MKKLLKYLEYVIFIFLNIIFSFSVLGVSLFLLLLFSPPFQAFLPHKAELTDDVLWAYALGAFLIYLFYIPVKLFIFQILFILKNILPNINCFLKHILDNKIFRHKILFFAFLIDLIFYLLDGFILNPIFSGSLTDATSTFIVFGGGVLPCYFVFLLCNRRRIKE